jgi:hypothetical protein
MGDYVRDLLLEQVSNNSSTGQGKGLTTGCPVVCASVVSCACCGVLKCERGACTQRVGGAVDEVPGHC